MIPWNLLFPFQKQMKNMPNKMNPQDMEGYMQGLFSNVIPQNVQEMINQSRSGQSEQGGFSTNGWNFSGQNTVVQNELHSEVFETHSDVFVRIPVSKSESLQGIKIYHTSNKAIIEGFPSSDDKHTITLPCIVKKKGAIAQFKDGTLELRIPKSSDLQYSEVDLSSLNE
ncbi:Hsp20/alpha crystallin family protein [Peribacillus alkalitolerans]|uniref:Hsp20/alpha crystallin family protein n=1 Tax=Peribacillus alkalitolerans TaxID=1550385 RepID=UPI0013D5B1CD|nr:Hsp20/alpha crystallin family protein [Peribacillus alkalitolerans]